MFCERERTQFRGGRPGFAHRAKGGIRVAYKICVVGVIHRFGDISHARSVLDMC